MTLSIRNEDSRKDSEHATRERIDEFQGYVKGGSKVHSVEIEVRVKRHLNGFDRYRRLYKSAHRKTKGHKEGLFRETDFLTVLMSPCIPLLPESNT